MGVVVVAELSSTRRRLEEARLTALDESVLLELDLVEAVRL